MLTLQRISEMLQSKNISKTEFYAAIGMSGTGFRQMLENGTMKVTTATKIRRALHLPEKDIWDCLFGDFVPGDADLMQAIQQAKESHTASLAEQFRRCQEKHELLSEKIRQLEQEMSEILERLRA